MTTADTLIANLLYRYAELMDAGRLEECVDLFAHARVVLDADAEPPVVVDRDGLLALWSSLIRIHADGTPRTRHLVGTPILEVDEEAVTAAYNRLQRPAVDLLEHRVSAAAGGRSRLFVDLQDGSTHQVAGPGGSASGLTGPTWSETCQTT